MPSEQRRSDAQGRSAAKRRSLQQKQLPQPACPASCQGSVGHMEENRSFGSLSSRCSPPANRCQSSMGEVEELLRRALASSCSMPPEQRFSYRQNVAERPQPPAAAAPLASSCGMPPEQRWHADRTLLSASASSCGSFPDQQLRHAAKAALVKRKKDVPLPSSSLSSCSSFPTWHGQRAAEQCWSHREGRAAAKRLSLRLQQLPWPAAVACRQSSAGHLEKDAPLPSSSGCSCSSFPSWHGQRAAEQCWSHREGRAAAKRLSLRLQQLPWPAAVACRQSSAGHMEKDASLPSSSGSSCSSYPGQQLWHATRAAPVRWRRTRRCRAPRPRAPRHPWPAAPACCAAAAAPRSSAARSCCARASGTARGAARVRHTLERCNLW